MVTQDGIELRPIPLPGVRGYYASRCGWIWSTWVQKWVDGKQQAIPDGKPPFRLKCTIAKRGRTRQSGYRTVQLRDCGRTVYRGYVHRLILLTFVGPPPDPTSQAAHENGDSTDNRVENLSWKSPWDNSQDRRRHGTVAFGEDVPQSKLTARQVLEIRRRRAEGKTKLADLAREYQVSVSTVWDIITKRGWAHV